MGEIVTKGWTHWYVGVSIKNVDISNFKIKNITLLLNVKRYRYFAYNFIFLI